VVIATDHYTKWPGLSNPIFDAEAIARKLQENYGFTVEHLYDPTRDQLRKKLDELHARRFNDGDQLLVFIAGHGDYDETNDIGYLVFHETPVGDPEHDQEMNLQELRQRIDTIKAKHIFLVMDSCFAGSLDPALGGAVRGQYDPIPLQTLRQRSADKTTRYFLTSGGKEYVPDGTPGNHSPFASLFITALDKADAPNGYLNLSQLPHYFERLATTTRAGNLGHNQEGADFFFVPISSTKGN
jgi:Caspase domain